MIPQERRHREEEGYIHSPVGSSTDSIESMGYVNLTDDTRWVGENVKFIITKRFHLPSVISGW